MFGTWSGSCRLLPQVQVVRVGEAGLLAELPVGPVGQPHLPAGLVQRFPEMVNKRGQKTIFQTNV